MTWEPQDKPWKPADYDAEVVHAVRAVHAGEALPHQQQKFWDWLMYVTAGGEGWDDLSFRIGEDGRRETDFAEGKRFVGLQVRKMLHPRTTPKVVKK